jgi:hypothetical protein
VSQPVDIQNLRRTPRSITAAENALVPKAWDESELAQSAQARRGLRVADCNLTGGNARVNALRRLAMDFYGYSPRARYINRYGELLEHLKQSLLTTPEAQRREESLARSHAVHMAERKEDGYEALIFKRHRIVPLVMGSTGWISKALEHEIHILFQHGKKNPIGTKLAADLTYIAYDAALKMHRTWFAK